MVITIDVVPEWAQLTSVNHYALIVIKKDADYYAKKVS
jgi:hypothetical protein